MFYSDHRLHDSHLVYDARLVTVPLSTLNGTVAGVYRLSNKTREPGLHWMHWQHFIGLLGQQKVPYLIAEENRPHFGRSALVHPWLVSNVGYLRALAKQHPPRRSCGMT